MTKINKEMIEVKKYLLNSIPSKLALTGRVEDWLKSDEGRLPASCTTFAVEDSMEGKDGIEDSWLFTSHGLRNAAGVAIDLSKLRPKGTDNGRGLVASGAVSFAKFYSLINQELRRGGIFKNGAVTLFLDYDHPDCLEYLNMTSAELPWAKRAVYVDEGVINHPIKKELARRVNDGTIWLAKKQYDKRGNRIYSNVCLEVLLPSRGTCILSSVNLGLVNDLSELPRVFAECMDWLCKLHAVTGVGATGHYLSPEDDKQVGLGVIGLSNFLAIHDISYSEFAEALDDVVSAYSFDEINEYDYSEKAYLAATSLQKAYFIASKVARSYGMERAFAIAPTASMSYRHFDAHGFTTSPELSPPIAHEVDRDSDTFNVSAYEYHPKSEIAKDVGWSTYWLLVNAMQRLQDSTGLGHAISTNIWSSKRVDESFIDEFMASEVKTTYYRISVDQEALDKSEVVTPDSDKQKLRGLYDDGNEDVYEDIPVTDGDTDSNAGACDIRSRFLSADNDPQYCSACGG